MPVERLVAARCADPFSHLGLLANPDGPGLKLTAWLPDALEVRVRGFGQEVQRRAGIVQLSCYLLLRRYVSLKSCHRTHDFSSACLIVPEAGSRCTASQLFQLRLPAGQSARFVEACHASVASRNLPSQGLKIDHVVSPVELVAVRT